MDGQPTFTWPCSNSTTGKTKPAVIEAVFGNGYRARVRDGLKTLQRTISIDVSPVEYAEAQAIHDFLDAQAGMPFYWTPNPPMPQVERRWTCDDYGYKYFGGLIIGITAIFMVFNSPSVP